MTTLFLFAHQDDEIGVLHEILKAVRAGDRVVCIYLTNGGAGKATPQERNAESSRCLTSLGVSPDDLIFLGTEQDIPDGRLPDNLERGWSKLIETVEPLQPVRRIFTHAFEGGHQDHDAASVIGTLLAKRLGCLEESRQFPLYRAPGGRFLLKFAKPLQANGPVERSPISINEKSLILSKLFQYPSQSIVMMKLGPRMALDFLIDGAQKLQPLSLARLREPPNDAYLYEAWKIYDYARFRRLTDAFLQAHEG